LPEGVDGSVLSQSRAALSLLESDVAQMVPLFSDMCNRYDRVRQARHAQAQAQAQAAGGSSSSNAALTASMNTDVTVEIASMQAALQQMQAHSTRCSFLSAHLESCSGAHSALYAHTLLLFNALQSFGPSLNSALASFSTLELEVESVLGGAAGSSVFELRNLTGFYVEFERAYDALLGEIQRRHRQMAHQQAMMQSFRQALDEAVATEQAEREAFANAHGRFLPPSLCPAIAEPVQPVRIVPEELQTALPVWIPTEAEQARQEAFLRERQQQQEQQQQQQQTEKAGLQQPSQSLSQQPSQPHAPLHGSDGSLDHSGNAAQVIPALSASHQSQSQLQQQQQQQQQQQGDVAQLDSLQHVLSHQYSGMSLRGEAQAAPQQQGGLAAPTPVSAQQQQQWVQQQQHQPQQFGAPGLPPSSQLGHFSSQPQMSAGKLQHDPAQQLQQQPQQQPPQQFGAAAPQAAVGRAATQPAKPVARAFDDED
jgi:hypothetical protein